MTDAVELHCAEGGDGPALVMLHGLYGSGNNWRGIARSFEAGHRVLRPDLRNHGQSPHCPGMDYRAMAADVVALLEARGIDQADIMGHSMGGKVAMALALTRPDRLRRLMAVDIAPMAYDHEAEHGGLIRAMQAIDLAAAPNRGAVDAQLGTEVSHPMIRQFLLTNLQRRGAQWVWRIPLATLAEQLPVIQGWPEGLGTLTERPVRFVHGGASDYVDGAGRAAIARHFPAADVVSYPGVGHWLHAEAPQRFTDELNDFVTQPHP